MVAIPVYCPHCGAIFGSRGFAISGNVRNLTLAGNREPCVRCGKPANVVDGVFDAGETVLTLIRGPQLTTEVLRQFSELLEKAKKNTITPDELQSAADRLNPELGKAVGELRKKSGSFTVGIVLLIAALQTCQFKLEATVDLNQLLDHAFAYVERSTTENKGQNAGRE